LRTCLSLTLLAALFMLASGCHKENIVPPREQLQTDAALDLAQAMQMFYGNCDTKSQIIDRAACPVGSNSPAADQQQMTVRPLFNAFSVDAGAQGFTLVTYAISPDCVSHACAPTIGMAVFSKKGLKWTMDASNRAVTHLGAWGKPPADVKLVEVGPGHRAVEVEDVGGGQGETTKLLQLLIPWNGTVNLGLSRIIADNDLGACGSEGYLPCYENHREVNFIRNDKAGFYNLELELKGTDLVGTRTKEVHGVETLKMENGKYVQVSRQGDLATADGALAQR